MYRAGHPEFLVSHPFRKVREMDGAWGCSTNEQRLLGFMVSQVPECEGPGAPGIRNLCIPGPQMRGTWGTRHPEFVYPRSPNARDLHPTDKDLSAGTPALGHPHPGFISQSRFAYQRKCFASIGVRRFPYPRSRFDGNGCGDLPDFFGS